MSATETRLQTTVRFATPRRPTRRILGALLVVSCVASWPTAARAKLKVVATSTDYAWAVDMVGKELVETFAICPPDQDAHFLTPRPSYAVRVAEAALFVDTGLDLELWAPVLLQKSGNKDVAPGAPGYVRATDGMRLLDVPTSADRSQGDVHVFGNPHVQTSPLNMRLVLRNVARGLARVDPKNEKLYRERAEAAVRDLDERTFGPALVAALGGDTLARLAENGRLFELLENKKLKGKPLVDLLGGWLGRLMPYRGAPLITYHNNWVYLEDLFGLDVVTTIELKPGVPPSAKHVAHVLDTVRARGIKMILAASYYPHEQVRQVAEKAGITPLILPFHVGGSGTRSYPELMDTWIEALARGLGSSAPRAGTGP